MIVSLGSTTVLAPILGFSWSVGATIGLGAITFLPFQICLMIIVGGMLLGCVGGFIVARGIR